MSEEPNLPKFKINGVTVFDALPWFEDLTGGPTGSFSSRKKEQVMGIAIHYDAVNFGGTTVDEERARMQATFNWHTKFYRSGWDSAPHTGTEGWNWPGIGYHFYVFPSGHIYEVGRLSIIRAHVHDRNQQLVGVTLAGNFILQPPVVGSLLGAGAAVHYIWGWRGKVLPVKGHRQWAVPGHGTSCPGDTYEDWLPKVDTIASTLAAARDEVDADAAIRAAITTAFEGGNWQFLHDQLRFIGFH